MRRKLDFFANFAYMVGTYHFNPTPMQKILLIEDEMNVASFIKKGLEEQSYRVDVAYDGDTGKRLAAQNEYDVILLDLILPNGNGLEVCKSLRSRRISTPICMLTALGSTDDIVTGLDTGADDYLTKPFKFKELLARIRALTRRRQDLYPELLKAADLEIDIAAKTARRKGQPIQLTSREFKLLEYFMKNKGRVLSRMQILEYVWEVDFDLGSNVVDVYVNYLRNKIDKHHPNKLIQTVIGMGYVLKEPDTA
jgi:two-component system, OmpR family, copper resistance phosphate regulon response regulator CusR